jgi:hypothetical protein
MNIQSVSDLTPLAAVLTALAAVLVTPLVSVYMVKRQTAIALDVALRQIRASVISANRQRWIDRLRDQLSELITQLMFVNLEMGSKLSTADEIMAKIERAHIIENKIKLLLNPHEEDHTRLVALLRVGIENVYKTDKQQVSWKPYEWQGAVISLSQEILKREWVRVKQGD